VRRFAGRHPPSTLRHAAPCCTLLASATARPPASTR